jgi:site-specific DNA recombinase
MMMALAQFEREQTAERTRDAVAARSERGLWNGGRLLGYDTDPNKKSTLIPNQQEAAIINFAFEKYLQCGSITETAEAMNGRGYRSKSYTSRRGTFHPGGEFYVSIVQHLLKNSAYIGKKEINRQNINKNNCPPGKEYRLVNAAWPAIVSPEKFEAVQQLMKENGQTRRNAAEPVKHAYVLSRGILHCGRCGSPMDGRYGTGRLGTKYFYYVCRNKECNLRVSANKIEQAVLERLKYLAGSDDALNQLTEEANKRLLEQKPVLEKQKQELLGSISEIKSQANKLLENLCDVEKSGGIEFVKDKLAELSRSRGNVETRIAEVEESLRQINDKTVETETIKKALVRINEVYDQLKPLEQSDLMGVVLKNAKVNKREIVLEIYALNDVVGLYENDEPDEKVCSLPDWLPESVAQRTSSVLIDRFPYYVQAWEKDSNSKEIYANY